MNLHTVILIIVLGLAQLAAGCSNSKFLGTNSKPSGDGKRPTEEGEGVPGYLTDPNLVTIERSDEIVRVTGASGAVAAGREPIGALLVCVFRLGTEPEFAGSAGVTADGAFSAQVTSSVAVGLRVDTSCTELGENTSDQTQVLFETPTGFVSSLDTEDEADDELSFEYDFCGPDEPCRDLDVAFVNANGDAVESIKYLKVSRKSACTAASIEAQDNEECENGASKSFIYRVKDAGSTSAGWPVEFSHDVCATNDEPELVAQIAKSARQRCVLDPEFVEENVPGQLRIRLPATEDLFVDAVAEHEYESIITLDDINGLVDQVIKPQD
jgi:hypothetical protein